MEEQKKIRDRKYCMILYPDDETHVAVMDKLQTGGYNYAAILHDQDLYTDGEHAGELKKPHWHVVVRFKNAVHRHTLAKEFGIAENYLESCKNVDASLLYLVHYGHEDKAQYEYEKVFGSLSVRLASLLADDDESTRALNIYDIIRNSPGIVTYTEVFEKACKSGLYGDFRRMGTGVMYLINDHNQELFEHFQLRETYAFSREDFRLYEKYVRGGG